MGNRKKRIEAQKIFDEFGWGKLYPKKIRRYSDQVKLQTVFTMYKYYKMNTVYDRWMCCNANITGWGSPVFYWYSAKYNAAIGRNASRRFSYMELGVISLDNKSVIDEYDIAYWSDRGGFDYPKTREEIERLCLERPLVQSIRNILESGGHVHDEDGFFLPEFAPRLDENRYLINQLFVENK